MPGKNAVTHLSTRRNSLEHLGAATERLETMLDEDAPADRVAAQTAVVNAWVALCGVRGPR